ncbi:hypothetical protein ADUPG1_011917, partial [Aduncisulcus paluster]
MEKKAFSNEELKLFQRIRTQLANFQSFPKSQQISLLDDIHERIKDKISAYARNEVTSKVLELYLPLAGPSQTTHFILECLQGEFLRVAKHPIGSYVASAALERSSLIFKEVISKNLWSEGEDNLMVRCCEVVQKLIEKRIPGAWNNLITHLHGSHFARSTMILCKKLLAASVQTEASGKSSSSKDASTPLLFLSPSLLYSVSRCVCSLGDVLETFICGGRGIHKTYKSKRHAMSKDYAHVVFVFSEWCSCEEVLRSVLIEWDKYNAAKRQKVKDVESAIFDGISDVVDMRLADQDDRDRGHQDDTTLLINQLISQAPDSPSFFEKIFLKRIPINIIKERYTLSQASINRAISKQAVTAFLEAHDQYI